MAWNEPGGKDPWGHSKNDGGPPDLDEIVKKMQDKINRLMGGGGSGGDGLSWTALGAIAAVGVVIWLLFGFYIVQPAEQGVVTRFGAYVKTTDQGLHWHIPYPVETVQIVNVEAVRAVNHEALMLTQDENIIRINMVTQYRVLDAKDYLFNVRDPDNTLQQAAESSLREVVGTSKMDDVITSERARVAIDTRNLIQEILDRYDAGINVVSVNMQDAQPPNEVQAAFADVIKAREDEERFKNQAEAYANEIVQRARGMSDKLNEEALAYKAQVVARAEGETQRFLQVLTEYKKAPEVMRKRLYLETMEQVLGNTRKIMMDIDGGNNLTLLPLDRILANPTATDGSAPVRLNNPGSSYSWPEEVTKSPQNNLRERESR